MSDTAALLYVDENRLLPATDPPARQIHIGAGCCIETLAIGMTTEGYDSEVQLLPDGPYGLDEIGRKPVAGIELRPRSATRPDELADAIGRRQTNRKPYTGPLLADIEAEHLRAFLPPDTVDMSTFNDLDAMRPLLDIFYRAYEIEVTTRRLWEERGAGGGSTNSNGAPSATASASRNPVSTDSSDTSSNGRCATATPSGGTAGSPPARR